MSLDVRTVSTPCYVCEEEKLRHNLQIFDQVQQATGCHIILALKGFAMFSVFPMIRQVLKTTTASSLNEARLGFEEFGQRVHLYAPAYKAEEFDDLMFYSEHIVFNSFSQWKRFKDQIHRAEHPIRCGIRINPEYGEVETDLYNPCAPHSRLGVPVKEFRFDELEGITGLHFHSLCGNNSDTLERTLEVVERHYGEVLHQMEWVNFGGGHHITRSDYDINRLCNIVKRVQETYDVEVYLEPGEAVGWQAGVLVASVLDIIHNDMDIALLDISAAAHMPDCLEMPYTPEIRGGGTVDQYPHPYRLTGTTCLAGDVIGDFSFPQPLQVGDKIVLEDMLHYTMVKNTNFNGVELPSIAIWSDTEGLRTVRKFGYNDYKSRLS